MTPENDERRPVWTYEDVGLFLGAILPALGIAALLVRPWHLHPEGVRTIAFQLIFYALLLGALYVLIALRHGAPLWRSLGWRFDFSPVWLAGGPPLAIFLAVFA